MGSRGLGVPGCAELPEGGAHFPSALPRELPCDWEMRRLRNAKFCAVPSPVFSSTSAEKPCRAGPPQAASAGFTAGKDQSSGGLESSSPR